MKRHDSGASPRTEELLAALSESYGPTKRDRQRMDAKLHAAIDASAASATPTFRVRMLGIVGVGALLGAGAFAYTETERVAPPFAPVSPQALASTQPDEKPTSVLTPDVPTLAVEALPAASVPALPSPRAITAAEVDDPLEQETRLLGAAARALRDGHPELALRQLDEHARAFPRGVLADERAVERIHVLCSMGSTEEAVRDADRFLAHRAASALTRRVEASCARSTSTKVDP